ncbi:hypothetical protein POMI540_4065 [Schizosaccharomyces pombe]
MGVLKKDRAEEGKFPSTFTSFFMALLLSPAPPTVRTSLPLSNLSSRHMGNLLFPPRCLTVLDSCSAAAALLPSFPYGARAR